MKKLLKIFEAKMGWKSPWYYLWIASIVGATVLATRVSPWFWVLVGAIWLPFAIPAVALVFKEIKDETLET